MNGSELIALNGSEVWAFVVELAVGVRLRLALDDWERLALSPGQRVAVRRAGRRDEWLFLAEAVELPPVVWVVMAERLRRVG